MQQSMSALSTRFMEGRGECALYCGRHGGERVHCVKALCEGTVKARYVLQSAAGKVLQVRVTRSAELHETVDEPSLAHAAVVGQEGG